MTRRDQRVNSKDHNPNQIVATYSQPPGTCVYVTRQVIDAFTVAENRVIQWIDVTHGTSPT